MKRRHDHDDHDDDHKTDHDKEVWFAASRNCRHDGGGSGGSGIGDMFVRDVAQTSIIECGVGDDDDDDDDDDGGGASVASAAVAASSDLTCHIARLDVYAMYRVMERVPRLCRRLMRPTVRSVCRDWRARRFDLWIDPTTSYVHAGDVGDVDRARSLWDYTTRDTLRLCNTVLLAAARLGVVEHVDAVLADAIAGAGAATHLNAAIVSASECGHAPVVARLLQKESECTNFRAFTDAMKHKAPWRSARYHVPWVASALIEAVDRAHTDVVRVLLQPESRARRYVERCVASNGGFLNLAPNGFDFDNRYWTKWVNQTAKRSQTLSLLTLAVLQDAHDIARILVGVRGIVAGDYHLESAKSATMLRVLLASVDAARPVARRNFGNALWVYARNDCVEQMGVLLEKNRVTDANLYTALECAVCARADASVRFLLGAVNAKTTTATSTEDLVRASHVRISAGQREVMRNVAEHVVCVNDDGEPDARALAATLRLLELFSEPTAHTIGMT